MQKQKFKMRYHNISELWKELTIKKSKVTFTCDEASQPLSGPGDIIDYHYLFSKQRLIGPCDRIDYHE